MHPKKWSIQSSIRMVQIKIYIKIDRCGNFVVERLKSIRVRALTTVLKSINIPVNRKKWWELYNVTTCGKTSSVHAQNWIFEWRIVTENLKDIDLQFCIINQASRFFSPFFNLTFLYPGEKNGISLWPGYGFCPFQKDIMHLGSL